MPAEKTKTTLDYKQRVPFTAPVREDGETHLFVCVNGKSFLIERGVEVMVPRYVVCAAEDSGRQRASARNMIHSIQKG